MYRSSSIKPSSITPSTGPTLDGEVRKPYVSNEWYADSAILGYLFSSGIAYVNPRLTADQATASMAPLLTFLNGLPAGTVLTGPTAIQTLPSFYEFEYGLIAPIAVGVWSKRFASFTETAIGQRYDRLRRDSNGGTYSPGASLQHRQCQGSNRKDDLGLYHHSECL